MGDSPTTSRIDALMERASAALAETDYFRAVEEAERAFGLARQDNDFERMSRICLPIQEARRQIRQIASDNGRHHVVSSGDDVPSNPTPGSYLVQPPMIGNEAALLRSMLDRKRLPVIVICREPMTQGGRWPVVAVGRLIARVQVDPPAGVRRDASRPTKDVFDGPIPGSWFERAGEAIGDAAIKMIDRAESAAYQLDDLIDFLPAIPDHEKLYQRIAEVCRQAMTEPIPSGPRKRRGVEDPFSF